MDYQEFLRTKARPKQTIGFEPDSMPDYMREDQKHVTAEAIRHGRYAIFADCGLGKTLMELEWAFQVSGKVGRVLIFAPLCVGLQTKEMGKRFGYDVNVSKEANDLKDGINITNYERMEKFDLESLQAVVLDESSILKNYTGKTRTFLTDGLRRCQYKLCASATPAPNDYMELGTHADFLNIMRREEMLAMYFVHDGGETQKWRVKGHAEKAFWDWINSWSVTYAKPSELNPSYSDDGFSLPKLSLMPDIIKTARPTHGLLFQMPAETLSETRAIRRDFMPEKLDRACEIISGIDDYCVVWCELNDEGDSLETRIDGARQLKGSMDIEEKEDILYAFTRGELKKLVTKAKITSFGLNWQHCNKTMFFSPSYSYEQTYQAIKRFHRFGQARDVEAKFVMTDLEYNVYKILLDKIKSHDQMKGALCQVS